MFLLLKTVSLQANIRNILTCMATLLSKDQVKFSKLNSGISNNFFVSCHKLLKTYSPSVLFKDELKLFVFERLKFLAKF